MISLGKVSERTLAIYDRFYSDREADRFANLVEIYRRLASIIVESDVGVSLDMNYLCLGEIVRSYFLDTIRYKEYHFDPKDPEHFAREADVEKAQALLKEFGVKSIVDLDPLSPEWTQLVHKCIRINKSKVAAYTAKWILRYKPISVLPHDATGKMGDSEDTSPPLPPQSPLLTNINEEFAYLSALTILEIDADAVSKKRQDELIYCFRFRNFDEAAYFMILTEDYLCSIPR